MNNTKIWILITGIVVIVSGFLLYSMVRSRETEKASFLVKIQELNGRVAEMEKLKQSFAQLEKDKDELEARSQAEMASFENQVAEFKKNESTLKAKIDTLTKEKDSVNKFVENSNAIIAKLNKKIETLEKERDRVLEEAQGAGRAAVGYIDPMNELPSGMPLETMGSKLAEEEIVDLGRILVHPSTHEAARVEHVNPLYGFIVLSAGTVDGLKKDSVVNITRNNRLVAKAVVKKVRDDVSSAVTLPEWTREEIRVGDLISVNSPAPLLAA